MPRDDGNIARRNQLIKFTIFCDVAFMCDMGIYTQAINYLLKFLNGILVNFSHQYEFYIVVIRFNTKADRSQQYFYLRDVVSSDVTCKDKLCDRPIFCIFSRIYILLEHGIVHHDMMNHFDNNIFFIFTGSLFYPLYEFLGRHTVHS